MPILSLNDTTAKVSLTDTNTHIIAHSCSQVFDQQNLEITDERPILSYINYGQRNAIKLRVEATRVLANISHINSFVNLTK